MSNRTNSQGPGWDRKALSIRRYSSRGLSLGARLLLVTLACVILAPLVASAARADSQNVDPQLENPMLDEPSAEAIAQTGPFTPSAYDQCDPADWPADHPGRVYKHFVSLWN